MITHLAQPGVPVARYEAVNAAAFVVCSHGLQGRALAGTPMGRNGWFDPPGLCGKGKR